jgi:hypothetical protein
MLVSFFCKYNPTGRPNVCSLQQKWYRYIEAFKREKKDVRTSKKSDNEIAK